MNYNEQIKQLEADAQKDAQRHAKKVAQAKILRLKQQMERLEETVQSLNKELGEE